MTATVSPTPTPLPKSQSLDAIMMQKAKELEAAFLSEMLSFTGLGETGGEFSGGEGEAQFASFLRAEQARLMVDRGGIGLAKTIFESLKTNEVSTNEIP